MEEPLTVESVRAFLARHDIEVVELPADTSTALLAAEALHTSVGSIVKSLLFMADDVPVLVLASGDRKVDTRRVAGVVGGRKVRLATPAQVLAWAGYAVGGVPPVAHRQELRVLMDRTLLNFPTVYAAAGAPNAIFPVTPDHLSSLAHAEIVDITQ